MLDAQITEDKKARAFVRPNYEPTDDYTRAYVEHLGEYLGLIGPLTRQSTRVKVIRCLSDFLMACRGRFGELIAWPTHQRHYIDAPYGRKIAERVKEVILLHEYLIPSEKSSVRDKLAERFLVNFLTLQDLKFTFHGIGPLIEVREGKPKGSRESAKTIPLNRFPDDHVKRLREQMNQIANVWRDQPLQSSYGEQWATGKRIFNNSSLSQGGRIYGDWQVLNEKERLQLTIGEEEVCEIDLKASYPYIIATLTGSADQITSDPYSKCRKVREANSEETKKKKRDAMKRIVSAYVSGGGEVNKFPRGRKRDSNKKTIPFKAEFGLSKREKVKEWVDDLEEHLPFMKLWNSDSFQLMYLESNMIVDSLVQLAKQGISCFPVHDSLIVPISKRDTAIETLKTTMRRHFGLEAYLDITFKDGSSILVEPLKTQFTTKKSSILIDFGIEEDFDLIED